MSIFLKRREKNKTPKRNSIFSWSRSKNPKIHIKEDDIDMQFGNIEPQLESIPTTELAKILDENSLSDEFRPEMRFKPNGGKISRKNKSRKNKSRKNKSRKNKKYI